MDVANVLAYQGWKLQVPSSALHKVEHGWYSLEISAPKS